MQIDPDVPALHEPLAQLETLLIESYCLEHGHSLKALRARNDSEALSILADAARYASERLTDIECRAHYIQDIHGTKLKPSKA